VKTFCKVLIALTCMTTCVRAQAPVQDPYSIGVALGGQGNCPVFISGVMPDSPAEHAGILGGDYLMAVAGTGVEGVAQALDLLRSEKPANVTLKLWRSGKEFEVVVGREKRSLILARNGGKSTSSAATDLDARDAEVGRMIRLDPGRVVGQVFAPSHYPENPEVFYPGFELLILHNPAQVVVGGIENGPALQAGVSSGDTIVSVNGVSTMGKPPSELERLFSSARPELIRLKIDRLGSLRTVEFRLEKALEIASQSGWRLANGRLIPLWAIGQDSRCFPSRREAIFDRTLVLPSAVIGGFIEAHWMEDGNSFWFAEGGRDDATIYKYDPVAESKTLLFNTLRLRSVLALLVGHELPGTGLPFDQFTFLPGEQAARFRFDDRDYILQLASYTITPVPPESEGEKDRHIPHFIRKGTMDLMPAVYEKISPDGRWFLGSKDGNLYLRSTIDDRSLSLTNDGTKDYGWDADGALWAPNNLFLGVVKTDQRDVPLYPIVQWLKLAPDVEWVRHAYTGSGIPKPEYYVVDATSKKQVRIDAGPGVLNFRGWRSDSSELLLTRLESKQLDFLAANPRTGATRLLFTETTDTFFDPGLTASYSPNFTPLSDNLRFLWLSERDGWNQIYLYDLGGAFIRKLTVDHRPVLRVIAIDEKGGWVYYTAYGAEGRPYDLHLYRVNVQGGEATRLTEASGQHDQSLYFSYLGAGKAEGIQISPSRQFFLDSHSDVNRLPQTDLRRADGKLIEVLAKANGDAVMALRLHPPEEFTAKAADKQTGLYGIVYKPYDFDSTKKYPVLDQIYAGFQTTWVSRTFAGWSGAQAQAFANLGFIVFCVDARGTPDRGKEFQDVVYRNLGRNEIPDHVAVLKQLAAERPYMDMLRVGVFGGSLGGYFTIRAMLQAPEVFQVGVAIAPISDFRQVSGSPMLLLGSPEDNKNAYEFASNLRIAGNLKGHLLLIHGTSDVNVPFTATIQMIDALERAGKPYDLVVLPEQGHAPTGQAATYYQEALKRYLVEHLNP
jgi:dipeptidyl aminopeptidase/acylaminoacyl peptidase